MLRLLLASLLSVASVSLTAPAAGQEREAAPATTPIVIGATHQIRSTILGDVRQINVWVPASYARGSERYPVLYLLDGALDQDFHHIAGLAQLGELSGTFGPLIVVGIQTRTRRAELTSAPNDQRYRSAFPEAGGADRFRRFIAEEVIPFVSAQYRVGSDRAIMGESLAGLFVVDTLLRQPELFRDYIAISPSLWWDDRADMRRAERLLKREALPGRRLFLAIANEGGTMQSGMDMLRATLSRRAPREFEWRYSDRSRTDTHSTVYHGAAMDALRWLYAAPPYDYGPTPWFMIEGASPPSRR